MWDEYDLSPKLTMVSGPTQGVTFRIGQGRRVIGRDETADIMIDDRKISRWHATVELNRGRAVLTDTGSTNGTWVNDERVAGSRQLYDGDRIRMGHVALRFFDPSAAATDPIGTMRYALAQLAPAASGGPTAPGADGQPARPNTGATPGASSVGAVVAPRPGETMAGRSGRLLLTLGGALAMAGWLAWAYLIW
jgi:predicted component of type VI protein secretion system